MATFPRTIKPRVSSTPILPGPLTSKSDSGVLQTRSRQRIGWTWTEDFLFKWNDAGRAFVALMIDGYRNGAQFTLVHQDLPLMGAGGGTPLVDGASQTGDAIDTKGWPNSTLVVKAGDVIAFAGFKVVHQVTADATSDGSGDVAISINPPIFSGGSPGDEATVYLGSNVSFFAKITALHLPKFGPGLLVAPSITWTEDP